MAAPTPFIIVTFTLLLGATFTTTITHAAEPTVQFSYKGANGPDKWGRLCPQFSTCLTGKLQSPVNIWTKHTVLNKNLKPLARFYHPANATLIDNGFNVGVRYEGDVGVLEIDDKNYTLKQMHWHSPSEHRIDGVQYPAELHLVHIADDGSVTVVAILYRYGHPDPLVSKIQKGLDKLAMEVHAGHEEAQIHFRPMDTKLVKKKTSKYYRYRGSFTTPPCTEKVIWNILGKVRSISKEQVAALKAPLNWECKNNSRPVQLLNGRHIERYDEHSNN